LSRSSPQQLSADDDFCCLPGPGSIAAVKHPAAPLLVSLLVGSLGYAIVALIQLPQARQP
jgi:hypothetical protein